MSHGRTGQMAGAPSGYPHAGAWVRRVAMNLAVSAFRRRLIEGRALLRLASQGDTRLEPQSTPGAGPAPRSRR
jgi:hypothetical protein